VKFKFPANTLLNNTAENRSQNTYKILNLRG